MGAWDMHCRERIIKKVARVDGQGYGRKKKSKNVNPIKKKTSPETFVDGGDNAPNRDQAGPWASDEQPFTCYVQLQ